MKKLVKSLIKEAFGDLYFVENKERKSFLNNTNFFSVSRERDLSGFIMEEQIATFDFLRSVSAVKFEYNSLQTASRIAQHISDEAKVALNILKCFIEASHRVVNTVPYLDTLSLEF